MREILGRSIISLEDLSTPEIEAIFETTDHIRENWNEYQKHASNLIAATLFYEPSANTKDSSGPDTGGPCETRVGARTTLCLQYALYCETARNGMIPESSEKLEV